MLATAVRWRNGTDRGRSGRTATRAGRMAGSCSSLIAAQLRAQRLRCPWRGDGRGAPQGKSLPERSLQLCFDSGASTPYSRTRSEPNSSVSPSTTRGAPVSVSAIAGSACSARAALAAAAMIAADMGRAARGPSGEVSGAGGACRVSEGGGVETGEGWWRPECGSSGEVHMDAPYVSWCSLERIRADVETAGVLEPRPRAWSGSMAGSDTLAGSLRRTELLLSCTGSCSLCPGDMWSNAG